jgi:uridylate kinase
MFINIATCFDHNFGHHQALNEHSQVITHIGYNTDPYLLTDYCVANMSREYVYKVTIMMKKVQKIFTKLKI